MSFKDRFTGVVIALLMLGVPSFLVAYWTPAVAAPSITDLGNGNKTAAWDFSMPSDYTTTNVILAGGASLADTNGQLVQDTTSDFDGNNLTWDSYNLTIGGGSISTRQQTRELVNDGGFEMAGAWSCWDSSDGNVTAEQDTSNQTGRFSQNMSAPPSNHFDTMDALGTWSGVLGGNIITDLSSDIIHSHEGTASVRLTVDFKALATNWAGLQRSGSWFWSPYDTLSMWLDTNYTGPQVLDAYVHLESGAAQWNSSDISLSSGWGRYEFNISGFSGLGSVNMIQIRFTNVTNTSSVLVWVDDIWLYHYEKLDVQSAMISQIVLKSDFTTSAAGNVILSFDYMVNSTANLEANLSAVVVGFWLSPPISVKTSTPWTSVTPYDLSLPLSPSGSYNLSFIVDVTFDTPFATSLTVHIDNVSLTVPDYRGGDYLSKPLDIGVEVFFDQLSFSNSVHPDTSVLVEVRGGWSADTADGSWTPWEPHVTSPAILLGGAGGRFLQYRVTLYTTNSSASVSFDIVTFTFHRHVYTGSVQTLDFTPPDFLIGWRFFGTTYSAPPATLVSFFVSDNSGGTWNTVNPDDDISYLTGPNVMVKADISTANTTLTPIVTELNVTYEYRGTLDKISVSPATWSGTADNSTQFTARAWDAFGHIVPFTPTWTEDDPAGTVDSSGLYSAGTVGTHVVCATAGGRTDCANVTVSVGSISSIEISPPTAAVVVGAEQRFDAIGKDSDGNDIALTSTKWTTDVGMFTEINVTYAKLKAQGTPATGTVGVRQGVLTATAIVQVTASSTLYINGKVPDQQHPEGSQPWSMDLQPYLPPAEDEVNLTWYLDGKNQSLYTVFGERTFGQHVLWFTQRRYAFGDNPVTLWLEALNGSRVSQALWINITAVNDGPVFYDAPNITVKYGSPYVFDYAPYIADVDTPQSSLVLFTDDSSHAAVQGLEVTYTYDDSYNKKVVIVKLTVSDGEFHSETVIDVTVRDNTTPNIVKPLPQLTTDEDITLVDAFAPDGLEAFFHDADGDTLTFTAAAFHLAPTVWLDTGDRRAVNVTPERDWYGVDYLRVRATDPSGGFAEQSSRVLVRPVNDPPVLSWHDDVYVKYDLLYELDLTDYVSDIDTPLSSLVLSTNRTDLAWVEGFVIHLFLPKSLLGAISSVALSISLSDGLATVHSNITITAGNNSPPILKPGEPLPDVTFLEDEVRTWVIDLDDYFIDPDSSPSPLSYAVNAATVIAEVDLRFNYLNLSSPLNWFGQDTLHVRASDGLGFVMGEMEVRVLPQDDAPVIEMIYLQDLGRGGVKAIDLRLYVHDIDNNITELNFTTNSPRSVAWGYMLVLNYSQADAPGEIVRLTAKGPVASTYRDFEVKITPASPDGGGQDDILAKIIWPLSLVIILLVAALGVFAYSRTLDRRYTVEDVFMVAKEGRLIMHTTRRLRADRDQDILAGMLTAIMMFIKDSFKEEAEDLKKFEFGDKQVLVERGRSFYLAAIYAGEPPETADSSLADFRLDVEAEFGEKLVGWSGDVEDLRGLKTFMDAFVAHRRYHQGDWREYARKTGELT